PASEDEKNRLTYAMNLAEALGLSGKLDEAMVIAEQSLEERERFYGPDHPGYAYGLDSVADVALALGRYDRAVEAAQKALHIYDAHRHARVPQAWAQLFFAGAGTRGSWKDLVMPSAMAHAVLDAISARRLPVAPDVHASAVGVVVAFAKDVECVLRAWCAVERRARESNDHASWRTALERVLEVARAQDRDELALDAE